MSPLTFALAALLAGGLDAVEVATRHEKAGRPHLALHLLDRITDGKGDGPVAEVRARLMRAVGLAGSSGPAGEVSAAPPPAPRASAKPKPAVPKADPMPLYNAGQWMKAAPLFKAALEANPQDFATFSYLTGCYWKEAERLVEQGRQDDARQAYDEGRRLEQMYAPNFPDLAASTAPDELAQRLGR